MTLEMFPNSFVPKDTKINSKFMRNYSRPRRNLNIVTDKPSVDKTESNYEYYPSSFHTRFKTSHLKSLCPSTKSLCLLQEDTFLQSRNIKVGVKRCLHNFTSHKAGEKSQSV